MIARTVAAATTALALGAQSPAEADWQQTRWGMSLQEVLNTAAPDMRRLNADESKRQTVEIVGQALATSRYDTGPLRTTAIYLFQRGRLPGVRLLLSDLEADIFVTATLDRQYGTPLPNAHNRLQGDCRDVFFSWRDEARGNVVSLTSWRCIDGSGYGALLYQPIAKGSETGL